MMPFILAFVVALALALSGCDAGPVSTDEQAATDPANWRQSEKDFKLAVSLPAEILDLSEDEEKFRAALEHRLEMSAKIQRVGGYDGLIQAMAANQVDMATFGAGAYASLYDLVGDQAVPLLTFRGHAGDMGYYSTIMVLKDSPYQTIDDLRGKRLAFVDYNSTSGYIYPRHAMREQGIDVETMFGEVGITGGHLQSVMALTSGQYDAVVTLLSGGTPETGFASGTTQMMADRGLIELTDYRYIWFAGPIPNSTFVMSAEKNQAFTDLVRGVMAALPYEAPEALASFGIRRNTTLTAVEPAFYESIIAMRAEEIRSQSPQ